MIRYNATGSYVRNLIRQEGIKAGAFQSQAIEAAGGTLPLPDERTAQRRYVEIEKAQWQPPPSGGLSSGQEYRRG